LHQILKMMEPFFGQSFWQGIIGNFIVNLLWSLWIGTALVAFLKYVGRIAWQRRQLLLGWLAFVVMILLALQAIRYNTVSAKESTIASLQSSVAELSRRLAHWRVSPSQQRCLILALAQVPVGAVQIYSNIGDSESYGCAMSIIDTLLRSKWRVKFAGSTPYPMPGLWILVKSPNGPIPPDAEKLSRAFQKCGIASTVRVELMGDSDWALVAGAKPD
jgi:hypothetical protein